MYLAIKFKFLILHVYPTTVAMFWILIFFPEKIHRQTKKEHQKLAAGPGLRGKKVKDYATWRGGKLSGLISRRNNLR